MEGVLRMSSYQSAVSAIETLGLAETNMKLACYWLSLWHADRPPSREDLDLRRMVELLPGLVLVDMHVGQGPVCRLSGTAVDRGLGRPLAGANLLDFVSGDDRVTRVARMRSLLDGAVAVSRTGYSARPGVRDFVEVLQLPLSGTAEDGSCRYLGHINWRPSMGFARNPAPGLKLGMPDSYRIAAFH